MDKDKDFTDESRDLSRRNFLELVSAGAAWRILFRHFDPVVPTSATGASYSASADKPPNILFLFTDDQRFDTIHALGNEYIITPNMDRLVRRGVSFTRATVQYLICVPSRAQLMSGRTTFRAPRGLQETLTFPEYLREAGYTTFGTGKWHNGAGAFARSFSTGGKIMFGGMSNHLAVPVYDFSPSGKYPRENRYTGAKFSSEMFSDEAVKFLHEYNNPNPFLMYVSYTAPHDPRMAPPEYRSMYDPEKIPLPANFMPEHPFDNGDLKIRDEQLAPWPRTPEVIRQHIADYYAMIMHVDAHIGRVLAALEETGHADNTVIIFAGDNGLAVGRHGLLGKENLYEHAVRVPLVISGPAIPRGQQSDALCYLLDLFPTICDLTGLDIPDSVEGKSLVPWLHGRTQPLRRSLYFVYKDVQRAVREDRYKLIEYLVGDVRTTQLFDLATDPWELHNLADDPDYAEHLTRLRAELVKWQRRGDDPLLGIDWGR